MPASTVSELPTPDRLAKGFSTAHCRQNNPPGSRCTSGCCSDCANPTCPFPRGKIKPGRNFPAFSKSLCDACSLNFDRTGVMRSKPTAQSRHDAECRQNNPPGSRCTSGCCSNCANLTCPFPDAGTETEGLESATRKLWTLALETEGLESATRKLWTLALEIEDLQTQNACAFHGEASVDALPASAAIPLAPAHF